MATNDITTFYKGETVQFFVSAKNADGTALTSPGTQTIIVKIATSISGSPMLTFNSNFVLVEASKFLVTLSADELEKLTEGRPYFYNVWSQNGAEDPRLQVSGRITLQRGIWD